MALAERNESVQLWDPGQASAEASLWRGRGPGTTSTVEGRSLWSLMTRHAPPPTIVKMDCEGAEYAAILTSPPGTWDSVEHVILEYHPVPGAHFSDLRRRLEDLGFHLEWHAPDDRDPNLGMACFDRTP